MDVNNLKIGTRLRLGFGLIIVLMVVIAGSAVLLGERTSTAVVEMEATATTIKTLMDALVAARQARGQTWYYLATGDLTALKDRDDAFVAFADRYAELDALARTAEDHAVIADFRTTVLAFREKALALAALKARSVATTSPEFQQAVVAIRDAQTTFAKANDIAVKRYDAQGVKAREAVDASLAQTTRLSTLLAVAGALAGTVLAWMITRSIARPIAAMTQAMGAIVAGDLSTPVPALANRDEIGAMARAVQVFKDNGLKLELSEAAAERQRHATDEERAAAEAMRAAVQCQQQAVVTALADGLERLSKGDLTSRLGQAFAEEYETLRADFNATADSLLEAMSSIVTATDGISTGSDQIAHASDDLSRRTEQQAASLEETAAALNHITETVKLMAANANEAAAVVVTTRAAAETSGTIVQHAVAAMDKIRDSSNQISNIIGVIDEIAFQTNLLALNAGVEAARAGDAGRGFAVVASEVRGLAQRSAEAAKEIKALIQASSGQVETGVVLVDKTGAALKDIVTKVMEMDTLVRQISASSQEQATGLAEINTAIGQMDQVVQQNAAMVEESTAAAHALKGETQGLTTMVGRFNLGDKSPVARGNPVHRAQAKLARDLKTPTLHAARTMLKTTDSVAQSASPDKDWEEF